MQTARPDTGTGIFRGKIAPEHAEQPVADPAAHEEKSARVRALLRASDRGLAIGCGAENTDFSLASAAAEIAQTRLRPDVSEEQETASRPGVACFAAMTLEPARRRASWR